VGPRGEKGEKGDKGDPGSNGQSAAEAAAEERLSKYRELLQHGIDRLNNEIVQGENVYKTVALPDYMNNPNDDGSFVQRLMDGQDLYTKMIPILKNKLAAARSPGDVPPSFDPDRPRNEGNLWGDTELNNEWKNIVLNTPRRPLPPRSTLRNDH
jgi:hypothetical protein